MTNEEVEQYAREDAKEAIDIARSSGDDAVVFITGNSHMPPLRAFGRAETVWDLTDFDANYPSWDLYVEVFEETLSEANVYLDVPEYDNSLYVVDLARWEYNEDNDGETLSGEWIRK